MSSPLLDALQSKVHEQTDKTLHLISLVPADRLGWTPPASSWTLAALLGHLLECHAGFCAVLAAAEPARLAHFAALRDLPVNHACSPAEAAARIALYSARIDEGFALLTDADLARPLATAFVPEGELLFTLLLGNLEHLINHKHQLFAALRQLGLGVATGDLYRFRGASMLE